MAFQKLTCTVCVCVCVYVCVYTYIYIYIYIYIYVHIYTHTSCFKLYCVSTVSPVTEASWDVCVVNP